MAGSGGPVRIHRTRARRGTVWVPSSARTTPLAHDGERPAAGARGPAAASFVPGRSSLSHPGAHRRGRARIRDAPVHERDRVGNETGGIGERRK